MLVVNRADGSISHRVFRDLPCLLDPGDLLVRNDTRVLPARLAGTKPTGGRAEALLLRDLGGDRWEAMVFPGRRLDVGARILFGDGALEAEIVSRDAAGTRVLQFRAEAEADVAALIHRLGEVPLPPYIRAPLVDRERYQTVYARPEGSAAAPTAGLHFTPGLLARLDVERVTLHVGLDTFRPLSGHTLEEHALLGERYSVAPRAWERIHAARHVLAVGTTTVRVVETLARDAPLEGRTELFVTPGFEFRRVNSLLTNFHLPRSTLLALVMAFAGVEETRRLYRLAVEERYRFYSFGDAMLIR